MYIYVCYLVLSRSNACVCIGNVCVIRVRVCVAEYLVWNAWERMREWETERAILRRSKSEREREIAHAKQSEGVLVYKCVCVCFCVALSERSSTPVTATPVSAFQPVRSSSNHFNNTQIVTPYTLNSQPSALNPEPQIFKPRPQAFRAFEPVCVSSE